MKSLLPLPLLLALAASPALAKEQDRCEIDIDTMRKSPIIGVSFIPSANLDEDIIQQRFGMPAERIRGSEHTEHFLYPDRGLDLILDRKGKEVLQYVAPKDFASLRDPLIAAAQAAAVGPAK